MIEWENAARSFVQSVRWAVAGILGAYFAKMSVLDASILETVVVLSVALGFASAIDYVVRELLEKEIEVEKISGTEQIYCDQIAGDFDVSELGDDE